jgi:hypothetical protein
MNKRQGISHFKKRKPLANTPFARHIKKKRDENNKKAKGNI